MWIAMSDRVLVVIIFYIYSEEKQQILAKNSYFAHNLTFSALYF